MLPQGYPQATSSQRWVLDALDEPWATHRTAMGRAMEGRAALTAGTRFFWAKKQCIIINIIACYTYNDICYTTTHAHHYVVCIVVTIIVSIAMISVSITIITIVVMIWWSISKGGAANGW